jgi:hypothetical protein
MRKPASQKYKMTNWKDYNRTLTARGSLTLWLDTQMQWEGLDWKAPDSGNHGPAEPRRAAPACGIQPAASRCWGAGDGTFIALAICGGIHPPRHLLAVS